VCHLLSIYLMMCRKASVLAPPKTILRACSDICKDETFSYRLHL
jgi:hypothetical protein